MTSPSSAAPVVAHGLANRSYFFVQRALAEQGKLNEELITVGLTAALQTE